MSKVRGIRGVQGDPGTMIEERDIKSFMESELGVDTSAIQPETPLFSSGIIDSFSLVSLITFLEKKCGFNVDPMDVTLENLDTIQRVLEFVARK